MVTCLEPRLPRFAALLLASLALCGCGGGDSPTSPPTGPSTTRVASVMAGDAQNARVGEAVPIAPSVRVVDGEGVPVAGVSVTFAATSGSGSIDGAATTSGSDGIAAIGAWRLGRVGENTLEANVSGATSGSRLVFRATGQEFLVAPMADTTVSGVVEVTRLVVPVGVTLTVTDSLVVRADSTIQILGTVRGACVPIRFATDLDLIVEGTIDNSCTAGEAVPDLTLIGVGGFEVDSASIQSSGDVVLTNDPTLTDADFSGSPAPVAPMAAAQTTTSRCRLRSVNFRPYPTKATNGGGRTGTGIPGTDGRTWRVECRGALRLEGGVAYQGQHGGDGGAGQHAPAVIDASAEGGAGGRGGTMLVRATSRVTFDGIFNEIRSGNGGRGGDASATSSPSGNGAAAPAATAIGGRGGEPGLLGIQAPVIDFNEAVDFVIGQGGDGGDAVAVGADGLDAQGSSRAQAGGPATATGGAGGGTPNDTLAVQGGAVVNNAERVQVTGGDAGAGGSAQATGGTGGQGSQLRPDGGAGGVTEASGGPGGTTRLRDHRLQIFGDGGNGGLALLMGARGGRGMNRCSLPEGFIPGGSGGPGGTLIGNHGAAGTGASTGVEGEIELRQAGFGGDGGHGEPAGEGGAGGDQIMSRTASPWNSVPGRTGRDCVYSSTASMTSTINDSALLDTSKACLTEWTTFAVSTLSPDPVDYQININGIPAFSVSPLSGTMPAAPGPSTEWVSVPVRTFRDLCSMVLSGPDVLGTISMTFTLGPTTVTKSFPVEHRFR